MCIHLPPSLCPSPPMCVYFKFKRKNKAEVEKDTQYSLASKSMYARVHTHMQHTPTVMELMKRLRGRPNIMPFEGCGLEQHPLIRKASQCILGCFRCFRKWADNFLEQATRKDDNGHSAIITELKLQDLGTSTCFSSRR